MNNIVSYVMVVCEKPSTAKIISAVLGAKQRGDGFFHGNGYLVSWCYGHLVELADPAAYGEKYGRWSRESLPILPKEWQYKASTDKVKQISVLRGLMNRADVETVINATDAGREGELIFRLVYDFCKCRKPIKRLWISSLEDSAIREGFTNLRPGADYDNLYSAALCRSQADWIVGINGTRLFSCLYGPTLNVGRVQSPALAMIVEREKAIAAFEPELFYTPEIYYENQVSDLMKDLIVLSGDDENLKLSFAAVGERHRNKEEAEAIRIAADGRDAVVLSVEKGRKTTVPPKLYDLTSLQRDANRIFGFTAQQTLDYSQSLYEAKIITYPRTDSQYLTEDMAGNALAVITALTNVFPFADGFSFVPDISRVIDNSKVSDHFAIIPTLVITNVDLSALPSGESRILSLIAARTLCAVSPIHVFESVLVVLSCGGHLFTAKGKTVLEDGWRTIDAAYRASLKSNPDVNASGSDDSDPLPELTEGLIFPAVKAIMREGQTKPPARFTEDIRYKGGNGKPPKYLGNGSFVAV